MIGYFDFEGLETYSGMGRRWWRYRLPEVPHLRLPGKILFKISDIDEYLARFRKEPEVIDLSALLNRVISSPRPRGAKGRFRKGVE